ncbi:MAG: UDP-N-acetylglucosamine:undecaprenyl-P N-acetylglucosaminyl 1-P transferase [Gallionellaceae bacterium]|nr:MAG: UDP-N-acetylglucosamine:undecaprenyl-P N-acetylglucosaminyl 1-P transferase [Gallionellaceae bacterium]
MIEISLESIGLILCTTIFLSMLLMPVASSLAHKVGAIDVPKSRSSHTTPKPRMGGLAMSLSLVIACLAFLPLNSYIVAFLSGLAVIVMTGVVDDMVEISPRWKFVGQILGASLFVYLSGMEIEHIGDIVGMGDIRLGGASFLFTVFCLVGAVNALNLADGLDGLAGGISLIASVFFAYFAWSVQGGELLIIAVALIGAILGFLRYNSYPARVFMGDSGSMMLGYVVAVLLITLSHDAPRLPVPALAMVVALPLIDTLLVMARRVRYGRNPFHPDRTHLHHRLLELGFPHPAVVAVIYSVMLGFGLLAVALHDRSDPVIFSNLVGTGLLIFSGVTLAQQTSFRYKAKTSKRLDSIQQTAIFKRISLWLKATARPVGVAILAALLLPALFAPLLALSGNRVLALYCSAALLVYFSFRTRRAADQGILHGTLYLTIFALLLIYNLSAQYNPSWLDWYLNALSAATLVWVVLKLFFSKHSEIIFASGFELLILFVSWFVPFVALEDLQISATVLQSVQRTCLLSIPFMLAMKINIRNQGQNHWVSIPLVVALAIVATRAAM